MTAQSQQDSILLKKRYSVAEAAELIGCCTHTLYRAVKNRQLAAYQFGAKKAYQFLLEDLEKWMESKRVEVKEPPTKRRRSRDPRAFSLR